MKSSSSIKAKLIIVVLILSVGMIGTAIISNIMINDLYGTLDDVIANKVVSLKELTSANADIHQIFIHLQALNNFEYGTEEWEAHYKDWKKNWDEDLTPRLENHQNNAINNAKSREELKRITALYENIYYP